ncbi:MAG TPA: hypothetical protein PK523_00230 [Elusimicrobiales bacterium]|nr:hypothetical protein [Elusimicrobiales bacterium]
MERYNRETYDFFARWHLDKDGRDIFSHAGIDFGNAFRIDIWNDITYYVRMWLNLTEVAGMPHEKIFAGIEDTYTLRIIAELGLKADSWEGPSAPAETEYYFPVFLWMKDQIHPRGVKRAAKDFILYLLDCFAGFARTLSLWFTGDPRPDIYVQNYHPTVRIIERLRRDSRVNVITGGVSRGKGFFTEIRLPMVRSARSYAKYSGEFISLFQRRRSAYWTVGGRDLGGKLFGVITDRISPHIPSYVKTIDAVTRFLRKRKLALAVAISDLGIGNCILLNYCRKNGIPSFMIINGLLTSRSNNFEAGDATWINSYGESIKANYFSGRENVVCLGDPRMDQYSSASRRKGHKTGRTTIVIGAGGFSNIDLNSYVACEFVFLYDVMQACRAMIRDGRDIRVVLKVRANGYAWQYRAFLKEYFPEISVETRDNVQMRAVLEEADLYVSIYSQTLFEASCLGVPVLYYKSDTEISYPPFDGKSELVTATSPSELIEKIEAFFMGSDIFEAFKRRSVMEQYVGPLDGKNTDRNTDFIYSLIRSRPVPVRTFHEGKADDIVGDRC